MEKSIPVGSVYTNGFTFGVPPAKSNHQRAKRGLIHGWSSKVSRNQTNWLYSIDTDELHGIGYSFTFTLKDCPESAADFHKLRIQLLKRLTRMDAIRIHWLIEWQLRQVPHLHGSVYFPESLANLKLANKIIAHWIAIAGYLGAKEISQNVKFIEKTIGWLEYLSKHASRGVHNYQRAESNIPPRWANKTGRMWGHQGNWPEIPKEVYEMNMEAYWKTRRMCRSWRLSDSRSSNNLRRIQSARNMLKCPDPSISSVRGGTEWINKKVGSKIIDSFSKDKLEIGTWINGMLIANKQFP